MLAHGFCERFHVVTQEGEILVERRGPSNLRSLVKEPRKYRNLQDRILGRKVTTQRE